ncbi:putative redox-active protein [Pelotomaculum sp. FP]|uniref:DVU_1555 family C-GCAxxG-C-C protein n=1 Tax=Pelotomaculum sp. FP TaxID=261474 RepID=UPI0010646D58|nr:DV_1555 family C-GCAxxG-C-C protein [Pelotomaculum sp. FP]TEB14678.1 putative redox-active protein [Pelotomaculum sp. FP]
MTDQMRIEELAAKGLCCTQIMVQIALEKLGRENEEMVSAVSGLCRGMFSGKTCGVLTGAAMALSLFDKNKAAKYMIPDLVDWFECEIGEQYGGIACSNILGDNPLYKAARCRELMIATQGKVREILNNFCFET